MLFSHPPVTGKAVTSVFSFAGFEGRLVVVALMLVVEALMVAVTVVVAAILLVVA